MLCHKQCRSARELEACAEDCGPQLLLGDRHQACIIELALPPTFSSNMDERLGTSDWEGQIDISGTCSIVSCAERSCSCRRTSSGRDAVQHLIICWHVTAACPHMSSLHLLMLLPFRQLGTPGCTSLCL